MKNKRTGKQVVISVLIVVVWAALGLMTGTRRVLSAATGLAAPSTDNSPTVSPSEIIYAITSANQLLSFDSASPGSTSSPITITGLVSGDTLVAIDFRPKTLALYGLGLNGTTVRLYKINRITGSAIQVGGSISLPQSSGVTGSETGFGFDFNPVDDGIRIVANNGDDFRLNSDSGAVAGADTALNPGTPVIVGAAYSNNFSSASSTALYEIDTSTDPDQLVIQGGNPVPPGPSPNGGVLTTVGTLGIASSSNEVGFDISSRGTAYAALQAGGPSQLYTVDLGTGAATLVGAIGSGLTIRDIAVLLPPVVQAVTPSGGNCSVFQDLLITGSGFLLDGVSNVTSVFGVERGNPSHVIQASPFVVASPNIIDAFFRFGCLASGRTFDIFVSGPAGTSTSPILVAFSCNGTAATISCPANITVPNASNQCSAVVNFATPPVSTNCTSAQPPICSPTSGSTFPVGTTTVTCSATDTSGNYILSCSFTITVNDTTPPTITCPANITQSTDPNQCSAVVNYKVPIPADNCPGVTATCVPASGSTFPKGTTTVTCTATDSSNNTGSCTFTVTVNDTQPPSITCPANITVATDPNQCSAVVTYPAPTVSDNCPGVGTPTCTPVSGATFPKGTTTVSCNVSDASKNTATCSFTITVNDTQAPSITCPANITVSTAPNQCSAVVTYPAPTVSDNCPGVGTPTCTPASGSTFPKGITTVTCNVSDASGNTASCSFTVTVNDTQPPTITCPANVTAVAAQTCPISSSATVTFPAPTVSDNCPGVTSVCTPPSGSIFPVGTTTVTCTATDTSGNTAICTFTVTVFSGCLHDDSNPGNVVLFNAATGGYRFCCGGTIFTGVGTVLVKGCILSIQHYPADRRMLIKFDGSVGAGTASLQSPPGSIRCTITDRNTRNNTCACP